MNSCSMTVMTVFPDEAQQLPLLPPPGLEVAMGARLGLPCVELRVDARVGHEDAAAWWRHVAAAAHQLAEWHDGQTAGVARAAEVCQARGAGGE